MLYFNKNFKVCLIKRSCLRVLPVDALMCKGLREGLSWGTLPRNGAQEDMWREEMGSPSDLHKDSRVNTAPLPGKLRP